jgi:hypothetical protein
MNNSERVMAWKRKKTRTFSIQCNKENDADVIARLDSQPNKNRYLINLIRNDMTGGTK